LPFQQSTATLCPSDNTFDAAMCIEVLEHVDDPRAFSRGAARRAPPPGRSVPNAELIPYLASTS